MVPQNLDPVIDKEKLAERIVRNEAIAELMKFKRYIPSNAVQEAHHKIHNSPIKWYYLPGVGRYNSFELKFHSDYNWLMSAVIGLKKYEGLDKKGSKLDRIFIAINTTRLVDLDREKLWHMISDYSIELLIQKQIENKKSIK